MLKVHVTLATAILLILACTASMSQEKHEPDSPEEILLRSNDYVEVLDKYWPRISLGDIDAMVISYNALNSCWIFRELINKSKDVNEFDDLMAGQSQGMRDFGRGVYHKCKNVVKRYDQYPGWEDLRLQAAIAGDRHSQLWKIREYYRYRKEYDLPRSAFPYSPAEFMIAALEDRDIDGFIVIATGESPWGVRKDRSKVTSAAWMLVACEYSQDCDDARSMEVYCIFMSSECVKYRNAREMIRDMVGSDQQFEQAQERSKDLITKIDNRDWEELGLDLVW